MLKYPNCRRKHFSEIANNTSLVTGEVQPSAAIADLRDGENDYSI
ncbi:hypothetical protein [Nostoc sp. MG11]|nr:hypothetical protein [Nostoc sp. MG11]